MKLEMFLLLFTLCIFVKFSDVSTSGCTNSPMDIVLLLDSSSGQLGESFGEQKQFASSLINELWDGSNLFGLITFGSQANIAFNLDTYQSISQVQVAVEYVWQSNGKADVGKALEYSIKNGFKEANGGRILAPDVLLLVTSADLNNETYARDVALMMESTGTQLFVVLVGSHISTFWYEKITPAEKISKITDPHKLRAQLSSIKNEICKGRGVLREWSVWTACGSSCGPGLRRRFRKCEKRNPIDADCEGELMHEERCMNAPCTQPVDGSWSFWDIWTDCSKTCGNGTQSRRRTCTAPFPENGGKQCIGSSTQKRLCANWMCPDCNRICPPGSKLSSKCDMCITVNVVLYGTVKSYLNRTMEGVGIFLESKMYESITTTDENGFYHVTDIFVADENISIKRNGYVDVVGKPKMVNGTHWVLNATMVEKVAPIFLLHPTEKTRLVGQSVSLCCRAAGQPAPSLYTWYRGLEPLGTRGQNGTLIFNSVSLSDEGVYQCSTETDAGSATSKKARLTVKDGVTDSCGSPQPLLEDLPVGCYVSGDTSKNSSLNVGTCGQAPCVTRSLTDNFTCTEWWPHYCCDSNADDMVDIQCDGFKYKATRVSSCSCRKCFLKTIVSGNAFGRAENGTVIPLKLGTILVYGKQKAMTNLLGFFSFEVPTHFEKIVVRLMDTIFKTFIDTTKTIELKPGTSTSINLVLPFRPQPVDIHSDSEFAMQVGTAGGSKSTGGILIPKNSLVTSDGKPYKGKAKAQVHYMDPRKREDFEASSGEFSYQEDGENCPLETYGVFKTHFEDDSGHQLRLNKPIQFELDPTVINVSHSDSGESNAELWQFDENTGMWKSVGKMAPKVSPTRRRLLAQMYIGSDTTGQDIPPIVLEDPVRYATRTVLDYTKEVQATQYYIRYYRYGLWGWGRGHNVDARIVTRSVPVYKTQSYVARDAVKHRGACFISVAVYSDFSGKDIAKDMVSVTAVTRDFRKNIYKGFETQPVQNGRKCLKIFCDSEVYLYAEKEGARLISFPKHDLPLGYNATNIKNSTEIVLYSRNYEGFDGRLGPVYFYEDEKACTESTNGFEFRFGMRYGKDPKLNAQVSENIYNNRLSWNPMPPDSKTRRVCFIKVLLKIKNNFDIRLLGISYKESVSGGQYGMYDVGPQPDKTYANVDQRASCVEFRCPGMVNDAGKITKNISTLLEVRLNPIPKVQCRFRQLKRDINTTVLPSGAGFQFYAEAEKDYGPKYGVYVKNDNKANTQNYCFQGKDTGSIGNGMRPLMNAAVEFDCT